MAKDIVLRTRKFINNRLLNRKQCLIDVFHPSQACLPVTELKARIAEKWGYHVDQVTLYKFATKFGGGKSTGLCLFYDTKDFKLKYEPKYRLVRDKLQKKVVTVARKAKKTLKVKLTKLHGKAKNAAKKSK